MTKESEKDKELEQAVIDAQGPAEKDLIEMKAEELIENEKTELRKKAETWAEQKALTIANKEKQLSFEMKQFNDQRTMIQYYSDGGALPKGLTEAQAMMVIQMGKQMNVTMFEALQGIGYVNGKMIIYGEVMVGQLTKSGYKLKFIESTDKKCTVEISGPNGTIQETFTIEQAQKAGWIKGFGPWKDQPHLMLRYKTIRQGMKFLCPEVMSGLTTYEEAITEIEPEEQPDEQEIKNNVTDKFKTNA